MWPTVVFADPDFRRKTNFRNGIGDRVFGDLVRPRGRARSGGLFHSDGDPKNAEMARQNFKKAGIAEQVRILTGDALDLLDTVAGDFDIILIDINKHQYPAALRKSIPRLKQGGLVITDNVLWSGKVTKPPKDNSTRGILEFNKMVYASKELFPVIVPLRDGVAVCRKA